MAAAPAPRAPRATGSTGSHPTPGTGITSAARLKSRPGDSRGNSGLLGIASPGASRTGAHPLRLLRGIGAPRPVRCTGVPRKNLQTRIQRHNLTTNGTKRTKLLQLPTEEVV